MCVIPHTTGKLVLLMGLSWRGQSMLYAGPLVPSQGLLFFSLPVSFPQGKPSLWEQSDFL